jgi:hypothetical protein
MCWPPKKAETTTRAIASGSEEAGSRPSDWACASRSAMRRVYSVNGVGMELDSLVMVELSVILQRQYGVLVPEEELADARDVNDIVSLMEDRRTAAA